MELYDVIRSLVTNAMIVALLFTLAQEKVRKSTLWVAFITIVALNFAMNAFFYMRADYTTLALIDMLFFVFIGAATKPLFKETMMQWLFNCFTVLNVYAIIVVISYYLCDSFPYPHYAHTALRAVAARFICHVSCALFVTVSARVSV